MKKILSIAIMACMGFMPMSSEATPSSAKPSKDKDKIVYICTGPKAKVYHRRSNCKGLNKCSGSIKAVRQSDASRYRRPCKICC